MIRAFVDESESNRRLDPNTYIVGAAVLHEANLEMVRAAMRDLRLQGQRKLHWRDESERRQLVIVNAITTMRLDGLVVAHVAAHRKPEARRRRALSVLLPALHHLGAERADFESRGPADDARDRHLLASLSRSRRFDSRREPLKIFHRPGPAEPALWVADAICGAVVASRTGDSRYADILAPLLTQLDCP